MTKDGFGFSKFWETCRTIWLPVRKKCVKYLFTRQRSGLELCSLTVWNPSQLEEVWRSTFNEVSRSGVHLGCILSPILFLTCPIFTTQKTTEGKKWTLPNQLRDLHCCRQKNCCRFYKHKVLGGQKNCVDLEGIPCRQATCQTPPKPVQCPLIQVHLHTSPLVMNHL